MTRHRDHDQTPLEPEDAARQETALRALFDERSISILDLGCGGGRIAGLLARDGHRILGVDRDPGVESAFLTATDPRGEFKVGSIHRDRDVPHGCFEGILLLGNVLMEFRRPEDLRSVFKIASTRLSAQGRLVIDDFPRVGWLEISEGRWADGIDDTGTMQMVWSPSNPEFVIRMGEDVDPASDRIQPHERVLRLWSRRELDDAAGQADLYPVDVTEAAESELLVYARRV